MTDTLTRAILDSADLDGLVRQVLGKDACITRTAVPEDGRVTWQVSAWDDMECDERFSAFEDDLGKCVQRVREALQEWLREWLRERDAKGGYD